MGLGGERARRVPFDIDQDSYNRLRYAIAHVYLHTFLERFVSQAEPQEVHVNHVFRAAGPDVFALAERGCSQPHRLPQTQAHESGACLRHSGTSSDSLLCLELRRLLRLELRLRLDRRRVGARADPNDQDQGGWTPSYMGGTGGLSDHGSKKGLL